MPAIIAPSGGYPQIHELKCWPEFFQPILDGRKTFELRKADRDYHVGDILELKEYNIMNKTYTGRELQVEITYILRGPNFGMANGYCLMSIKLI